MLRSHNSTHCPPHTPRAEHVIVILKHERAAKECFDVSSEEGDDRGVRKGGDNEQKIGDEVQV